MSVTVTDNQSGFRVGAPKIFSVSKPSKVQQDKKETITVHKKKLYH